MRCADCERLEDDLAVALAGGDEDLALVVEDDLAHHQRQEQDHGVLAPHSPVARPHRLRADQNRY